MVDVTLDWIKSQCEVTESGCWEWGRIRVSGYGVLHRDGIRYRVHRLSLAIATGLSYEDLPRLLLATHDCDNKPCCNPDHLRWGTHSTNLLESHDRNPSRRARQKISMLGKNSGKPSTRKGVKLSAETRSRMSTAMMGSSSNHTRWHTNRGIVKADCEFCVG